MSQRQIVTAGTTEHYRRGTLRLIQAISQHAPDVGMNSLYDIEAAGFPSHADKPYAFKPAGLRHVVSKGADQIMWCDSSVLPVRSLEPIWAYAEQHGAWIANNGYSNYEWTADSAYPDLFSYEFKQEATLEYMREVNRGIPHVVATAFALDLRHRAGKAIFDEYCRLGLETRAFCGPWANSQSPEHHGKNWRWQPGERVGPCGPPDVRGHRHDQTALSVCAWRAGVPLTTCPEFFSYPPAGWSAANPLKGLDERTILVADGSYV